MRSAIRKAGAGLAPSVAASGVGAIAGAVVDGPIPSDAAAWVIAVGVVVVLAFPILLVLGVIARRVIRAWDLPSLVTVLRDEHGGMPWLAGWVGAGWLGLFVVSWAVFQMTWLLRWWTAFKPLVVGMALPIVAVASALGMVAMSRPLARGIAAIAGRVDRRWRARGHRTLLTPVVIFGAATLVSIAAVSAVWWMIARPRLGAFDPRSLYGPLVALGVWTVVSLAWRRLGRVGPVVAVVALVLATITAGIAIVTVPARPAVALSLWANRPLARIAIEHTFDLEELRDRLPPSAHAPKERPGAIPSDVLLVVLDGVRADRLSPYGGLADMPVMRELASRGAVFDHVFATSNTRIRSLPSLLTGTDANRVRLRGDPTRPRLDPRHVVLAERMRAAGYETAGFVCCTDLYGAPSRRTLGRGLSHYVVDDDGQRLAYAAQEWIAARNRDDSPRPPIYVQLHLDDALDWDEPPLPADPAERIARYDRSLRLVDSLLADVVRALSRRPTLVVVTATHGAPLVDQDQRELSNAQLRVPLLITGGGAAVHHVRETASLVDVVPTILDLAGFAPPRDPSIDGRSLASVARNGRPPETKPTAFASAPGLSAVIQGRWKLIERGTIHELYDVFEDVNERTNRTAVRPEVVTSLRRLLTDHGHHASRPPF